MIATCRTSSRCKASWRRASRNHCQRQLRGAERKAVTEKPTGYLTAYDAYLRGIDLFSRPGQTEENERKAADAYTEAVRLDPQFAQAWAALSRADASLYFLQFDTSAARKEAARSAAETATRFNPSSLRDAPR